MATGEATGGLWAAIARKEAPVEKEPDVQSLLSTAGLKTVVVDANAIIGGGVRLSGIADQFFTVKEVLAEVRDPASRFHLATLPFEIKCLEPSDEALMRVAQFARATGDVQSLSDVDLKVIALTYTLEAQVHGTDHIRTRPPPVVFTPTKGAQRTKDPPGWGSVPNPEEWEGIDDETDGANTGSRILGFKSLSLDSPASNSLRDKGLSSPNGQIDLVLNSSVVQDSKSNETTLAEIDRSSPVVSKDHEEPPRAALSGESTQTGSLQEADSIKMPDALDGASKAVEDKQISKQEADADGDDWERAVSRSTRRQYLKRVQRRALRQQLAESLGASDVQNSEKKEPEGAKSAEERAYEGSANGDTISRPELSGNDAKHEDQFGCSGSDHEGDYSPELTHKGLGENEAGIDEADSADSQSNNHDDTDSNTDAAASAVDTEQNWSVNPMWTSSVACMTSDYAMQNVILQMGLRLLSPSGQHIKELNKWILKCQACFKVTNETDRLFCPKCGNGGTLCKVSITIGPDGCVLAGRNRRSILRGTRYSLPLPKGGREGALLNPVLREDQLPAKPRKVKKPEFEAFSSSDVVFANPHERKGQQGAGVKAAAAIFSGRRNPNERRRVRK